MTIIPFPDRRKPSWHAATHIVTRDGHVLRKSGTAGAHGVMLRTVDEATAEKVRRGLSIEVIS